MEYAEGFILTFPTGWEILGGAIAGESTVVDGNPIIGELKHKKNIICSFGHHRHGILLGPITAKIVVDYVLEKKIPNKYYFFSPKRFNL